MTAAVVLIGISLASPLRAQELTQHQQPKDVDKGPRALGLVQLNDKGKARFIPIVIMINGKFYDADSYKADPVPMALDFGIIYEGFRTGVSQGLFTITQPGQLNHEWIAEGTWLPEGSRPKTDKQKYAPPVIDEGGRDDDRPTLHRRPGGEADKDDAKPAANAGASSGASSPTSSPTTSSAPSSSPSASPGAPQAPAGSTSPASKDADKSSASKTADASAKPDSSKPADTGSAPPDSAKPPSLTKPAESASAPASSRSLDQPIQDPNRPVLRRGKPDPNAHHDAFVNFDDPTEMATATKQAGKEADAAKAAAAASVQTFPAISDAAGPDPRPYSYDLKPAEEAIYRNKMLELVGEQISPKAAAAQSKAASSAAAKSSAHKKATTAPAKSGPYKPELEDLKIRVFDLSNSNEPVLVLSGHTPVPAANAAGSQLPQEITLVARTNLEGELQKLFFQQTDSRHLDIRPRMELIDAVDADGDGRGELLFRRTFDSGSTYAIYRVSADQLWPLWAPEP
jgi:hypothetical protein